MQVKFTAKKAYIHAWERIEDVPNGKVFPLITAEDDTSYFEQNGYTLIGTATVTIELHTEDQIMATKMAALKTQLLAVRAENQQRENAILDQISKLQAIDYTGDAE
jgi:hypothetical protein